PPVASQPQRRRAKAHPGGNHTAGSWLRMARSLRHPQGAHPIAGPNMTAPDLLNRYQAIADLSGRMLSEARANRWDAVYELGEQYQAAIEQLRDLDTLSAEDREARRQ